MLKQSDRASLELTNARAQIAQLQEQVERKDAEIDRLLPQALKTHMQGSSHRSKDAEIDRLQRELDSARTQVTPLRVELEQAKHALDCKQDEVDSLLPKVIASHGSSQSLRSKESDIEQLKRELDSTQNELRQCRRDLETRESQYQNLLKETAATRAHDLRMIESKDAEITRLDRELEDARVQAERRPTTPLRQAPVECLDLRPYRHGAGGGSQDPWDQFEHARVDMVQYLNHREKALNAREARLGHSPRITLLSSVTPCSSNWR